MGEGGWWEVLGLLGSRWRTRPLACAIAAASARDFSFVGDMSRRGRGWCLFRIGWLPGGFADGETGTALVFMPREFKRGFPLSSGSGSPSCRLWTLGRLRGSCPEVCWPPEWIESDSEDLAIRSRASSNRYFEVGRCENAGS